MKNAVLAVLPVILLLNLAPLATAQESTFQCGRFYTGGQDIPRPPEGEYNLQNSVTFLINNQEYDVYYEGQIDNVTTDIEGRSIKFNATSDSSLLPIKLPRALIDSVKDGRDVPFTVTVNGEPVSNVTENIVPSTGDRMLCIPLSTSASSSQVQIFGTTIAPEFGSLVMFITAASIVAIIGVGAMFRTRFSESSI